MSRVTSGRFWWRLFSLGLLLGPVLLLLALARQVGGIRQRVLFQLRSALSEKADTLPPQEKQELRGALLCLELIGQDRPQEAIKLARFVEKAQIALSDGQLTPQEAQEVARLARELCSGGSP
ncbi:MAG: hypothetical protein ACUVRY_03535 [Thermoanaerobaculaceae bacterium]